jgi:hypothetical protein
MSSEVCTTLAAILTHGNFLRVVSERYIFPSVARVRHPWRRVFDAQKAKKSAQLE